MFIETVPLINALLKSNREHESLSKARKDTYKRVPKFKLEDSLLL